MRPPKAELFLSAAITSTTAIMLLSYSSILVSWAALGPTVLGFFFIYVSLVSIFQLITKENK
tara:strand:+ start:705 stop:890 length:186 start_codon:yes stop_codon:yes gene_type:complete